MPPSISAIESVAIVEELDFLFEPLLIWLATTSATTRTIAPPTIARIGASLLSRFTGFLLDSPTTPNSLPKEYATERHSGARRGSREAAKRDPSGSEALLSR